jgi:hypothetical protein
LKDRQEGRAGRQRKAGRQAEQSRAWQSKAGRHAGSAELCRAREAGRLGQCRAEQGRQKRHGTAGQVKSGLHAGQGRARHARQAWQSKAGRQCWAERFIPRMI